MIWKKKDARVHGGDLRTAFDGWGFRMRGSWDWILDEAAETLAIGSLRELALCTLVYVLKRIHT